MGIYVGWLVDAARQAVAGTGKQVIVSPGWATRGQGGLRVLEVVVGHHTATPESAPGDYPSLNVVQNGRAGLIGLLSQLGLGRTGNVYVMGAGLAYHAGASAYAGFVDLNDESIGIEAEDSGDGTWTPDQLFMYPRLVGACLFYMRRGPDRYASHRTVARPAGRKGDPAGISDTWMRQQIVAQSQQENGMPLTEADLINNWSFELRSAWNPDLKRRADDWLSMAAGSAGNAENSLRDQVLPLLAQILANQRDDLDTPTVLAQLDTSVKAATIEALNATILPAIQRIEEALAADDASEAKAIVVELGERLRSTAA